MWIAVVCGIALSIAGFIAHFVTTPSHRQRRTVPACPVTAPSAAIIWRHKIFESQFWMGNAASRFR
jgi:hypothetical protein